MQEGQILKVNYQERRISDHLQNLPFCFGVFCRSPFLDDAGFLQNLHGKQSTSIAASALADEKHFSVSWKRTKMKTFKFKSFITNP